MRLELLSATPRATLAPLSCSANFPSAQYLDIHTLKHELIVNHTSAIAEHINTTGHNIKWRIISISERRAKLIITVK